MPTRLRRKVLGHGHRRGRRGHMSGRRGHRQGRLGGAGAEDGQLLGPVRLVGSCEGFGGPCLTCCRQFGRYIGGRCWRGFGLCVGGHRRRSSSSTRSGRGRCGRHAAACRHGLGSSTHGPILEDRARWEAWRQAVSRLVRDRAWLRSRFGEAAMAVIGLIRASIAIKFESDERAGDRANPECLSAL
jgi:hypothetical protein